MECGLARPPPVTMSWAKFATVRIVFRNQISGSGTMLTARSRVDNFAMGSIPVYSGMIFVPGILFKFWAGNPTITNTMTSTNAITPTIFTKMSQDQTMKYVMGADLKPRTLPRRHFPVLGTTIILMIRATTQK